MEKGGAAASLRVAGEAICLLLYGIFLVSMTKKKNKRKGG